MSTLKKANSSDLEEKLKISTSTIKFQCEYQTTFGQNLRICGNLVELGEWDIEKSIIMETNENLFPIWESKIELECPIGMTIEYKYVICNENGKKEYEKLPNDSKRKLTMKQTGRFLIINKQEDINYLKIKKLDNQNEENENKENNDIKDLKFNFKERKFSIDSVSGVASSLGPIDLISYENNKMVSDLANNNIHFALNNKLNNSERIIMVTNYLPIIIEKKNDNYEMKLKEYSSVFAVINQIKNNKKVKILWVGMLRNYFDFTEEELYDIEDLLIENDFYLIHPKKEHWEGHLTYVNQIMFPIFITSMFDYKNEYLSEYEKYFQCFYEINIKYAEAISNATKDNDLIILNDITLALVPNVIMQRNNNAIIGIYIHSPFPASDVIKAFPRYQEIIKSILLCNVIGFYFYSNARNFMTTLRRFFGLFFEIEKKGFISLNYLGRTIIFDIMQGQIDLEFILNMEKDEQCQKYIKEYENELKDNFKIICFDNISAVRALGMKLRVIDLFFEKNNDLISKTTFIIWIKCYQIEKLSDKTTKDYVEKTIKELKEKYKNENIIKVEYYIDFDIYKRLAIFKLSDVLLYPQYFEGQGIYANEFIAIKTEDQRYGLILSENITSTSSIPSIIKTNAFDSHFIVDKLKQIYNWTPSKNRYEKDYTYIKSQSVLKWVTNFIYDIKRTKDNDSTNKVKVGLGLNMGIMKLNDSFSPLSSSKVSKYYSKSKNRIFFLDYENTLQEMDESICDETTSIKNSPSKKNIMTPNRGLLKILDNLSQDENNLIFIISKYETDFISHFFSKVPNLGLCGENGFFYKYPKENSYKEIVEIHDWTWCDTVIKILKEFTEKTEGSFYIEKKSSIIWNYKQSDSEFGPIQSDEIKTHLMSIFSNKLDIENNNGTLEIKPKNVNKGAFVAKIIQEEFKKRNIDFIIAFGDDNTDEEMFSYFNSAEKYFPNFNNDIKVITATIGKKPSKAKYFISDVNDCIGILDSVTHSNFNLFERGGKISKTDKFLPQINLNAFKRSGKRNTLSNEEDFKNLGKNKLFKKDEE